MKHRPQLSSDGAVAIALPFDDEGDAPVAFALTAAARRALDPDAVPALSIVPDRLAARPDGVAGTAGDDEVAADDLRPAQARALRRSGMRIATIAAAMAVDAALIAAWTEDLLPAPSPSGRPVGERGARPGPRRRRAPSPSLAAPTAAAGLAVAMARIDADGAAVTLRGDQPVLLAAALAALRAATGVAMGQVRVSAAVAGRAAADDVRAELARVLGLPIGRVIVGRSHGPGVDPTLDVRIRVADPRAVRVIDAWATAIVGGEQTSSAAN